MDKEELKVFVNKIFKKGGYPPVKQFAKEFSDGSKLKIIWLILGFYRYVLVAV